MKQILQNLKTGATEVANVPRPYTGVVFLHGLLPVVEKWPTANPAAYRSVQYFEKVARWHTL